MKILIAPDKFKGTLSAAEAAQAIARGWRAARSGDRLELLPITDGGDGFGRVMSGLWGAKPRRVRTTDAAGRPVIACWWWSAAQKAAIIESAEVIGLAKLPSGRFHPFALDTAGLAAVLRAASDAGAERCLIGIGGSATNDAGFGIATAMGWQFLDDAGKRIERWPELGNLRSVVPPETTVRFRQLVVAVDVQNPLLGKNGATRIYGPQKGLRPRDFANAEAALAQLARVVKKHVGEDFSILPGAGAAGGLGFGLAALSGARLESGFDLFARECGLKQKVKDADLLITGEGRIDQSTVMGKGVGELAKICKRMRVPCVALAGDLDRTSELKLFSKLAALVEITSSRQAMARAGYWLAKMAAAVAVNELKSW